MTQTQTADLTGRFVGAHRLSLYYRAWVPQSAKATVVVVHGLGEHISRYAELAAALNQAGYAVWGFDNQGHGQSPGQRGHIERWQDYSNTIAAFLQLVRQQMSDLPLFIFGHSLGGLMTLVYAIDSPQGLSGLVVSGPPIQTQEIAKPWLVVFAKVFSRLLPRLSLDLGTGGEALSRNPKVVRRAQADPLMHSVATLRWGTETMGAIAHVRDSIAQLRLPVLLLHGGADKISDVAGSHEIFDKMTHRDKTLLVYPDAYHELHNDLNKDEVIRDIVAWLDEHREV